MIEKPIKVTNYLTINHKFRDENHEKCLGDIYTYIKGFKHEKDRVEVIIFLSCVLGIILS